MHVTFGGQTLSIKKKPVEFVTAVAVASMLLLVLFCMFFAKNEETRIEATAVGELEEWNLEGTGAVKLPYDVKAEKYVTCTMTTTLPDTLDDGMAISFLALYCKCEVYAGGREIGSYATIQPLPIGRLLGNIRVIVPVSEELAGEELTVCLTPYYDQSMSISRVYIGYEDALKYSVLTQNAFRLVICIFLIAILIVALGVTAIFMINGKPEDRLVMIHFCSFIFAVTLWIICSSDLPQFVTNNNEVVSLVSYLCLATMVSPFLGFCQHVLGRGKKLLYYTRLVGWCIPLINVICFATKLADPPELVLLTHLYMCVGIGMAFILALRDSKKDISAKLLILGILELALVAVAALVAFFAAPGFGYDGNIFGAGLTIFALICLP